jgi:uncharacterized cupredoxin-like copper-binding protein
MRLLRTLKALGLCAALAAAALGGCGQEGPDTSKTVVFRFSRFEPGTITVPAGTPITLRLRNDDPIAHEWIVGTEDVHERHRTGTEPYHDKVPSEVTVPALQSRETTLTFTEAGEYSFICHLPGHEAYGMKGLLKVVAP